MLSTFASYIQLSVEKPRRVITTREKYLNSILAILGFFIISRVPLYGSIDTLEKTSWVHFRIAQSWFALGFLPYTLATLIAEMRKIEELADAVGLGFLVSLAHIGYAYGISWPSVQMIFTSWLMMQALLWQRVYGAIPLSKGLVFFYGSTQFVQNMPTFGTLWSIALSAVFLYLFECTVPVSISQQKIKHCPMCANISVLHNGTTPLTLYYVCLECLIWFDLAPSALMSNDWTYWSIVSALLVGIFVYAINGRLHRYKRRTGLDLVKAWEKQRYFIKGWRSTELQGQYVEKIIQQCLAKNTTLLVVLSCVSTVLRPSIPFPTLCVMTELALKLLVNTK